jgi:methionyl-tRNA synthetase
MVSFEDFKKLDLRIGKVLSVENHPNADKLYVLKIDIGGGEIKQSVAGLRPYLTPEQLLNRSVAIMANLEPGILRGVESQVMILAVTDLVTDPTAKKVLLLVPEKEVPTGSRIS